MLSLLAKSRSGILPLHGGSKDNAAARANAAGCRVYINRCGRQYRHLPDLGQLQIVVTPSLRGKNAQNGRIASVSGGLLTKRVVMYSIVGGLLTENRNMGTAFRVDFTVDEVVFAQEGDLCLLGARTLEGMNLRVDPRGKKLVAAGPVPAA